MRKEITICFRTSEELRSALKKHADEERRSISSLIENICYDFLHDRKALRSIKHEKRLFPRRKVSVPALVQKTSSEQQGLQAGLIVDISPGGVQLSIPKEYEFQIHENKETSRMEIIFTLPSSKRPLTMQCVPRRSHDSDDEVRIGASFVDPDFTCIQALQTYLLQ